MGQLKEKAKEEKYTLANLPKLTSFLTRASCPASEKISPVSAWWFSPEDNFIAAQTGDRPGSEIISNESTEILLLASTEIPGNEVETVNANQLHIILTPKIVKF